MPRTASTQVQSRSNAKARPSANVRAENLVANTPVLFRLPNIPNVKAEDLAATFSETVASLPTATLAAVAMTAQPVASPVVAPSPQAAVDVQPAPQQTWWEHWSSGIVLIVLLIALATASILAWQGGEKGNSKLMADTNKTNESNSSLSDIEVPKLEAPKLDSPKLELPVSTKSNVSLESTKETDSNNDAESSLIPNGPNSLTFDSPTSKEPSQAVAKPDLASKPEPVAEPESYATASLRTPVAKPQESLFKDDMLAPSKPNVSAQPASSPSQRTSPSSAANPTVSSPSLWDSSKTNSRETSKPLSLELSTDLSKATANTLAPTTPKNDSADSTAAKLISQTTEDTSKSTDGAAASAQVSTNMNYAAKTSTPELDQKTLIESYRKFSAATQKPAVTEANRYTTAANAGSPVQSGGPTGTPATPVGFTQQPTNQQPAGQQSVAQRNTQPSQLNNSVSNQGSNNYTLQPTQNFAPNNAAPQYNYAPQNQQFPNQPLPNQQFQNQQYPAQQNPNQPNVPQTQPGLTYPNSFQNNGVQSQGMQSSGIQYTGAQVPYTARPTASQPGALQLPAGPIGGYGASEPNGSSNGMLGTGSIPTSGTSNSLNYPSLR